MHAPTPHVQRAQSESEAAIRGVYGKLLERWNQRDATGMASLFTNAGNVIGFDGSQMNGPAAIEAHLRQIFQDHQTAAYVSIVREVRFITPAVAVLRGVAGMVPPGWSDLHPDANAIQTLIVARHDGHWRIEVFQNTPAAFHGRPELREALTAELRQLLEA